MQASYRASAAQAAVLTAFLLRAYDEEKSKNTTRARISAKTLRRLSGRAHLREAFIDEWADELGHLGWSAFPVGDNFALIRMEAIGGWPRIASKRIADVLGRARNGELSVFDEVSSQLDRTDLNSDDD